MKFLCSSCFYEKEIPPDAEAKYAGKNVACPKCKLKSRVEPNVITANLTPPTVRVVAKRRRWPLFVGLGCALPLALFLAFAAVVIFVDSNSRRVVPPAFTESARFSIVGPASTAIVKLGEKLFTNRNYKLAEIPPLIDGWVFTRHAIRTKKTYEIDVLQEGYVYVCYSNYENLDDSKALFDDGWIRIDDLKIGLDNGDTGWIFARKFFAPGRHRIPLGHPHSGTLLLTPQLN